MCEYDTEYPQDVVFFVNGMWLFKNSLEELTTSSYIPFHKLPIVRGNQFQVLDVVTSGSCWYASPTLEQQIEARTNLCRHGLAAAVALPSKAGVVPTTIPPDVVKIPRSDYS